MKESENAILTQQQAGNQGCGMGTENACCALTMGPGELQCGLISNPAVAQMAE